MVKKNTFIGVLLTMAGIVGAFDSSVVADAQVVAPHISEIKEQLSLMHHGRLQKRSFQKKPAITNVRAIVRNKTIYAITKEIRELKEIIQSIAWFDSSMRSGRLRLDGYAKSLIEHAFELCDGLSRTTTASDIDGAKFVLFNEILQKMIEDTQAHTPQNIGVLRRYIVNRLIHRYDELSRLLMLRASVPPVKDATDLEKIYTTFGYNFSQLYKALKIPADAVLQDVTHIIATFFAPAVEEGNVSFQQVLYNAYKALVRTKGLAFLVNQKNLTALGSPENIGTQLALIFEYVSRQKSLYRSFRAKEDDFHSQYKPDTIKKARYMSYALSSFAGIWQLALKNEIARWAVRNKASGTQVISRFKKLMEKSTNQEFNWSLEELQGFMQRF